MWDVVVIGAGLAGLMAARRLHQAGFRVLVIEKSRGLGGRLASRRVDGQPIDHGCRFIQPSDQDPLGIISGLLQTQKLQSWYPDVYDLTIAGDIQFRSATDLYYVAPLGITVVAKALADGLQIYRSCRVTQLSLTDKTWYVHWENARGTPNTAEAKSVIAAIPAPQIVPLVSQSWPQETLTSLVQELAQVQFDPVITVMAGYSAGAERPFEISPSSSANEAGTARQGWMVFGHDHAVVRWAGLDSSKRQAPSTPVVVLHSTSRFAANYLETRDLVEAGQALLKAATPHLGAWLETHTWMQTHRWRYGLVERPLEKPMLRHEEIPGFVACGDWCGGVSVKAAFKSGLKAADEIMQGLTLPV